MTELKSIWHSKNEMPQANKDVVEHWINCYDEHCYSMWKQRPDGGSFDSHTIAWCYLDDLLACEKELITTRKALDVAVGALKYLYTETKGNHYRIPDLVVLSKALEQTESITKGVKQ